MTGPPRPQRQNLPELVAGIGGLALSVSIAWGSFELPEFPVRFSGPAFYPRVLAVILALVSAAFIVRSLRGAAPPVNAQSKEGDGEGGRDWLVLLAMAASVVYYLALPIVGFVLTTVVYFAFLVFLMQPKKKVWKTLLWSVASTLLIYLVFAMVLKATLPVGQIFR